MKPYNTPCELCPHPDSEHSLVWSPTLERRVWVCGPFCACNGTKEDEEASHESKS